MSVHLQGFKSLMSNKSAVIAVVGMGYVGQPLALRYSGVGYKVLGFDIDEGRVEAINAGRSSIEHISTDMVGRALELGLEATTDFSRIAEADAIILCVPTPLSRYREPDLSFVVTTCEMIGPYLRPGQVVSLESTTYPGTTEEEVIPRLTQSGLKVGQEIFSVYSPEREDPGNMSFSTKTIPKVVGGATEACLEAGLALYEAAIERLVPVSSTRAAEMTKLMENIQRAVNIGLVNEMKIIADRMGLDIFEIVDAAATKPFGFMPYYPGPGLGGHCIPVDPFYLTWKAREFGLHTRFIELAGEINKKMPEYVVEKLINALNRVRKPLMESRILLLGIAYKKNVDDMRESPAVEIMELLRDRGAIVAYSDPHVAVFPKMRQHRFELESTPLTAQTLSSFDAVVLATDHDKFDLEFIRQNAPLVLDCRGVYRGQYANVFRA